MSSIRFSADYAKHPCSCKKCKKQMEKGALRLAKIVPNPFSDKAGDMKKYFHTDCLFQTFRSARSTTKIIEGVDDVENYANLMKNDKDAILALIMASEKGKDKKSNKRADETLVSPVKRKAEGIESTKSPKKQLKPDNTLLRTVDQEEDNTESLLIIDDSCSPSKPNPKSVNTDDSLFQFNKLCDELSKVGSYLQKTQLVKDFITKGSSGGSYTGDLYLLVKLLLPGVVKRVYNINSKQLIKLFAQILNINSEDMLSHLHSEGDISKTISYYFENNSAITPCKRSTLTLPEIDAWLDEMTKHTKEDDQQRCLFRVTKRCNNRDLITVIRLLKHDLRINAGAKHILNALADNAYAAFQSSRDLRHVVDRIKCQYENELSPSKLTVSVHLGIPCIPMLAEVCRSTDYAMKKCPHGMYAEIKYDGERIQIHKDGHIFHFYSRSLKPVQRHKIEFLENYIPKAFPGGESLIIDSEVLLIDRVTGKPLPFGSLGVHKRTAFKNANVCLFVFDCLLYQKESLMDKPLCERKKFLEENMKPIKNYIMFSEMQFIKYGNNHKLNEMVDRAIKDGLEGLVIKDVTSVYEPGKRHWLKIKKDYLLEGSMADAADLIVLGAYYGTGNKGGLMSVFLMGCYDPKSGAFCTVTKCGNGHNDVTLEQINKELKHKVIKINRDFDALPTWLLCNRHLVPDFVVKDPKKAPVWEISGAEFTSSDAHTANGISIRFPRATKIRDDKTWETATNLVELQSLYMKSKERADFQDDVTSKTSPDRFFGKQSSSLDNDPKTIKKLKKTTSDDGEMSPQSLKQMKNAKLLFEDKTFFLPDDLTEKSQIIRQIMYYGGDVTDLAEEATHMVVTEKRKHSRHTNLSTVSIDWIKQCIKQNRLLP